jgi:hypothetical protein
MAGLKRLLSFYTASTRLRNGTLICSVGSAMGVRRGHSSGLVLDLTLSAVAAVASQQRPAEHALGRYPSPEVSTQALSMAGGVSTSETSARWQIVCMMSIDWWMYSGVQPSPSCRRPPLPSIVQAFTGVRPPFHDVTRP